MTKETEYENFLEANDMELAHDFQSAYEFPEHKWMDFKDLTNNSTW